MDELVRWFGEQLDTDERIARAATEGPWSVDDESYAEAIYAPDRRTAVVAGGRWGGEAAVFKSTADALHIAGWDPARVLREITARRQTIAQCRAAEARMDQAERDSDTEAFGRASTMLVAFHAVIRNDAAVYCARPGYRLEWRP